MENQGKGNCYDQCKSREDKPTSSPLTLQEPVVPLTVMIDNLTSSQRAKGSSDTIGHHHKQTLSRCLDGGGALLINKDTTRDIEEIECHTIDDTRQDKHDDTGHGRITDSKETETEHPCKHGHQHHHLDTISFEEKRYHQDTESLTDL